MHVAQNQCKPSKACSWCVQTDVNISKTWKRTNTAVVIVMNRIVLGQGIVSSWSNCLSRVFFLHIARQSSRFEAKQIRTRWKMKHYRNCDSVAITPAETNIYKQNKSIRHCHRKCVTRDNHPHNEICTFMTAVTALMTGLNYSATRTSGASCKCLQNIVIQCIHIVTNANKRSGTEVHMTSNKHVFCNTIDVIITDSSSFT